MSVQSTVLTTTATAAVSIPPNHRMHTIGVTATGGYVLIDVRVPGSGYEPVMDGDTDAPLQMTGDESVSIEEISIEAVRFTPMGATYSAVVTSQGAD